jgi:hypothetical protein
MTFSSKYTIILIVVFFIPLCVYSQVTYTPNPLDFGSRGYGGDPVSNDVWINNNTDNVLTVFKAEVISSDHTIYCEEWSGTIEPHSQNFIEVGWRPLVRGINTGSLIISHSFSEQPDTVKISAMTTINLTFWEGVFKPEFLDVLPNDISTGILTLEVNPLGGLLTVTGINSQTSVFAVSETSFVFGGAKSIGIDFKPPKEGTYYDTLTIYSDATNSPTLYPLKGNCLPSYFRYDKDLIEFPEITADENSATYDVLPLTISYISDENVMIEGKLSGKSAYRFENGTSDSTIEFIMNSSLDIGCNIIFDPRTEGNHVEPLIFTYDGYGSPDTVMLKGSGIQSCISANRDTLLFPYLSIGESTCQELVINYTGVSSIYPGEPIEIFCKIQGTHSFTVNADSLFRYFITDNEATLFIECNPNEPGVQEADLIIYTRYEQISPDTVKLVETGYEKFVTSTRIADVQPELPVQFTLFQNFPNPFNPSTIIKYALPKPAEVRIEVYNATGQTIWTFCQDQVNAGYHAVEFNGQDLSSGIYFYRIRAGEFQDVKKMIVIR